ncbi:hypothetical protein EBZ37_12815, partial [bacterium]|nr:hypothetical protein [bacterium]
NDEDDINNDEDDINNDEDDINNDEDDINNDEDDINIEEEIYNVTHQVNDNYLDIIGENEEDIQLANEQYSPVYGEIRNDGQFNILNVMINDLYMKHLVKKHILDCFVYRYRPPKQI